MSARSYLSIGDVLTLLRQEFPDVTISKIRFLESQGLVNPERTPSGYRKFYEHDVERLRWVLRQQREHFLPLKVIKDRLDDGDASTGPKGAGQAAKVAAAQGAAPTTAGVTATRQAAESSDNTAEPAATTARREEPVLVGQRAAGDGPAAAADSSGRAHAQTGSGVAQPPSPVPGDGGTLPGIETAGRSAGGERGGPPATAPSSTSPTAGNRLATSASGSGLPTAHGGSEPSGHADNGAASSTTDVVSSRAATGGGKRTAGGQAPGSVSAPAPPSPSAGTPSTKAPTNHAPSPSAPSSPEPPSPVAAPAPSAGPSRAATTGRPGTPAADPATTSIDLNGASLSIEDLSSASGLDVAALRELQEYGLLHCTVVAGVENFDEEALAVSTLAAKFARYGIEPRHLRLYKNAADREAGFVEQIVLPLVRQRNPEARARAHETADDLTSLGQQLRGSLLRSALGDLLNG